MLNMTDGQVRLDAINSLNRAKHIHGTSAWVDSIIGESPKYSAKNCIPELDDIINSLTKAIEKGDNLQLGIVLGQSLTELKKIRTNLLFA